MCGEVLGLDARVYGWIDLKKGPTEGLLDGQTRHGPTPIPFVRIDPSSLARIDPSSQFDFVCIRTGYQQAAVLGEHLAARLKGKRYAC